MAIINIKIVKRKFEFHSPREDEWLFYILARWWMTTAIKTIQIE
jgi:hypothetical protein